MNYLGKNWWAGHAEQVIKSTYGDDVQVKPKDLLKFGQNKNVGTSEATVMELLGSEVMETYATDNVIDAVVSDDAGNTQDVVIEGHSISGGVFTFVSQTVTLNGQTKVDLDTPLARATRIYNADSSALAASSRVYVYNSSGVTLASGVPDIDAQVHLIMDAGEEQSLKAATAFSNVDYGLITQVYGTVDKKTAATVDFRLKVRTAGGVFRTQFKRSVASTGNNNFDFQIRPFLIVPKNADVIVTAVASTTGVSVSAGFNCLLAKIIGS